MKTIAVFRTEKCPDREPDFLSNSYSAYWDLGHGVIRSSDHWAGWSLCTGQASCIWGFEATEPASGAWKTGYCAYADFKSRRLMPVMLAVADDDRTMARKLMDAGGYIDLSSVQDASSLPRWVSVLPADSALLPADIRSKVQENMSISRLIYASPATVGNILDGAGSIRIGQKLEEPDWA